MKDYEEIIDALKAGETLRDAEFLKVKLENGNLTCINKYGNFVPRPNFEVPAAWLIYYE